VDIVTETARAYQAFAAGNHTQAADFAQRVLRQSPDDPGALTLLGRLALIAGEPDAAHDLFARVLERHPQMAALWLDLAMALRDLGKHRDALAAAERAVGLKGGAAAQVQLGEIWLSLNERGSAADAFHAALAIDPDNIAACRGLCQSEGVGPESPITMRMEAMTGRADLSARHLAQLHYSLAQVYRRAGAGQEFIRHLFAANAKQRMCCQGGRAEYDAIFARQEAAFTRENFAAAMRADPVQPAPLFVLGMPRSGTTLVEQLVAAHPDVTAGGELDYMRRPLRRAVERQTGYTFPEGFASIPKPAVNSIAQAYARRLSIIGGASRHVTDKTPGNYHLLGLLRVLFPAGKIIHVARDPMDTCFSILQYPFDERSPHTCDVQLLAYVYARYVGLMQRWRELFGDEFLTVQYEQLVASPAAQGARLFEYCGLQWDDSYMAFHEAGGAVRTFSAMQVRRPIYTSSVGSWREFAAALSPLQSALERELQSVGVEEQLRH
jgi:tetratricopeptide (TPR) repeat protein